jgi:hypothetical protein
VSKLDLTRDRFGHAELAAALELMVEKDLVACETKFRLAVPSDDLRKGLALALWKTLRNRRAGSTTPAQTRDALEKLRKAARELEELIRPMVQHPSINSVTANDAAFLMYVCSGHILDPVKVRELWAELRLVSDAAAKAKSMMARSPKKGRTSERERHAVMVELRGLASQFNGGRLRKFTKNTSDGSFGGDFFLLFKTIERAVARFDGKKLPKDATLAKFIERKA